MEYDYMDEEEQNGRINPVDVSDAIKKEPKDLLYSYLNDRMKEKRLSEDPEYKSSLRREKTSSLNDDLNLGLMKSMADLGASFGNTRYSDKNSEIPTSSFNPDSIKKSLSQVRQPDKKQEIDPKVLLYLAQSKDKEDMFNKELEAKYNPPMTEYEKAKLKNEGKKLDIQEKEGERKSATNQAKLGSVTGLSVAEKQVDTKFAADYLDWNTKDKSIYEKNMQRLTEAKKTLLSNPDLTGNTKGRLSDWFKSEEAIKTRDNIRAAANDALKATLGSSFTEREGERIMNQAYNETLSPAANLANLELIIKELNQNAATKDSMAKYYEQIGTIKGWSGSGVAQPEKKSSEVERKDPKTGKIAIFDANTQKFLRYKD